MKARSAYSREGKTNTNFSKVGGYSFHRIKLYLKSMDEALKLQRVRIEKDRKGQMKKYPLERHIIAELYDRDIASVDVYFKRILLNSAFIGSFAIFESVFQRMCHRVAYKYFKNPQFDSGPSMINKYRNYIISILGEDFSKADQYWQQILRYSELRNVLAHHGSVISKKSDMGSLVPFLKSRKHITVRKIRGREAYWFAITNRQFIFEFLDCVRDFDKAVLWELPPGRRRKLPHVGKS